MDLPADFALAFGPMVEPLAKQLERQGMRAEGIEGFERARAAITFLHVEGYLSDGLARASREKLMSKITQAASPLPAASPRLP